MEDEIVKDLDIIGRKLGLKGFELPKKLRIINEGFSTKNNLMTSILKLKPREIKKKYIDVIKEMYEEKLQIYYIVLNIDIIKKLYIIV